MRAQPTTQRLFAAAAAAAAAAAVCCRCCTVSTVRACLCVYEWIQWDMEKDGSQARRDERRTSAGLERRSASTPVGIPSQSPRERTGRASDDNDGVPSTKDAQLPGLHAQTGDQNLPGSDGHTHPGKGRHI